MRAHMSRVLVISNDFVNQRMAGPAIRSFELSRQLHRAGNEVTLASRAETDLPPQPFPIIAHDTRTLEALGPKHDVILFQGHILDAYPFLAESGACLVADLYGPFTLELLVLRPLQPTVNDLPDWDQTLSVVDDQLRLSDYFLCASEKQFDYWVGALSALNRINPQTFARDPSMRSLIDLVPFGLPEEPPVKRAPAMRGVIPGIGDHDLILLAGTIYNWLDPLTLIRGVATASRRHPELRLVFMGTAHPNRYAPKFWMIATARRLAEELGLLNRVVFFNEDWVPYENRADWLLEADIGVSTHSDHLEARYAFRTRFLDFFWTGLPILCTAGDTLGDTVEQRGMGITVQPGDPDAIAAAIDVLADPAARRERAQRVAAYATELTWPKVAAPLIRYCANPTAAPDLVDTGRRRVRPVPLVDHRRPGGRQDWRALTVKAISTALYQGPMPLVVKSSNYIRRRIFARLRPRPDRPLDPQPDRRAGRSPQPKPPVSSPPAWPAPAERTASATSRVADEPAPGSTGEAF